MLTKEEGHRHWSDVHGPLCAEVPGLERDVQEEPQFDGYSCGWWADREAFEASMRTPEWAALVEDGHGLWDEDFLRGMSAHIDNRYTQNHVVGAIGEAGETDVKLGFDGFSECWFDDEAQFTAAVTSDGWAAANEDGPKVFDVTGLWGAALEERVVKDSSVLA